MFSDQGSSTSWCLLAHQMSRAASVCTREFISKSSLHLLSLSSTGRTWLPHLQLSGKAAALTPSQHRGGKGSAVGGGGKSCRWKRKELGMGGGKSWTWRMDDHAAQTLSKEGSIRTEPTPTRTSSPQHSPLLTLSSITEVVQTLPSCAAGPQTDL